MNLLSCLYPSPLQTTLRTLLQRTQHIAQDDFLQPMYKRRQTATDSLPLNDRWRSTAIGICLCGAGVGTFLLAPLESYLTGMLPWHLDVALYHEKLYNKGTSRGRQQKRYSDNATLRFCVIV